MGSITEDIAYHGDNMSVRELEDCINQIRIAALLDTPLTDEQVIEKIKSYPRGYKSADSTDMPKRDIYDKIHLISSIFTMTSAGVTIASFIMSTAKVAFVNSAG